MPMPNPATDDLLDADAPPTTRAMRQALGRLLDQVRGSREVLTHLAALERILKTYGLASFDRMQLSVLERIVAQLGGLPIRPDDRPLQTLMALLSSTLERRLLDERLEAFDTSPAPYVPTVESEDRLTPAAPGPSPFVSSGYPGATGRQPR
jgi:hypothetical protein